MNNQQKTLFFWVTCLVIGLVFFQFYEQSKKHQVKDFNYPKFLQALEKKQVIKDSIVFNRTSQQIKGLLTEKGAKIFGGTEFVIEGNVDDKGFEILRSYGITPSYKNKDKSFWATVLISWFPLILLFGVFIFFIRQLQMGSGKAFSFGKSRARLVLDRGKATFKDVAGIEEAKEELREIVEFLKEPKRFTKLGGQIPKGVLLIGSPGTGKTLLARAVAGEAKVPFFTISGSDFVEMFVGVGASRVRDLFVQGRKNSPCLIFIDEIDAVGRQRGAGLGGGHDEREQTLNQLLVEMDGFDSKEGIILIAATNRPDVLDPALLRPGRFDRRVMVSLPDLKGRLAILKVHTRKTPLSSAVELEKIARGTPGFSGADLKNLINEGSLMAAFKNKLKVEMEDLEKARDKVMMGSERKSFIMSDKDKKITAYHEAGHAIVGKSLPLLDPIHKVTIVPRGMALGVTQTLPEEDLLNMSKDRARNTLSFLFGGRVAEEEIFKDYTSGASNDIEKATSLARSMVCEWGMSEKLGPLFLGKEQDSVFVGRDYAKSRMYSEASAKEIDAEIHAFVDKAYKKARQIIKKHLNHLHIMAQALLDFETIDSEEVDMIMKGKKISDLKKYRQETSDKIKQERKSSIKKAKKKKKSSDGPLGSTIPSPV
ncbi:MAG: ATP-dependent zinc metalloprotease FtsH [Bdellovibrionales bacterium]